MFKPPKRSKHFEYKSCKYYFQLDSELYDLSIDVFYEFSDHQPWKHLGVCSELEISRKAYPTEYFTNQFISSSSKSDPSQTIDEFLIACHKSAMMIIDKVEEFTQKMDMDFHPLAAKISDTDVKE